ncbi:hypothetical protein VNI00_000829 [Paramarasmius palmivorus]|uniref:Very-long-chain (3R)-3-hydroxyacyl-CoA dehydratase n=1 Tax=Paramarasmius palmivorus TaxID=297713 RepID=A0AAW0EA05_9AGAR
MSARPPATEDKYSSLQKKADEMEKGKKAAQAETATLKSTLSQTKSELRDTTVKLRMAEKQLALKEKPHKAELEKEKRRVQTLTEQLQGVQGTLKQRDLELTGMQALKEELVRASDREAALQTQLQQTRAALECSAHAYATLSSHVCSKAEYDDLRMRNVRLEMRNARLERKLANSEAQAKELVWLVRRMGEENSELRCEVEELKEEVGIAWGMCEEHRVPERESNDDESGVYGIVELQKNDNNLLKAELDVMDALVTLERAHGGELLDAYADANVEIGQRNIELDTAQKLFVATTHTVGELERSLEEWKAQAKSLENRMRDKQGELENAKEASIRFKIEAQKGKMVEEGLRAEIEQLTTELMDAERFQEAYYSLHEQVETLAARNALAEDEAMKLSALNAEILGHRNPAQRIMYVERIREELADTRQRLVECTRANEVMVEENDGLREELTLYLTLRPEPSLSWHFSASRGRVLTLPSTTMTAPKKDAASTKKVARKGPPAIIKFYLVLYNILSAAGWGYVLVHTVIHILNLDGKSNEATQPIPIKLSAHFTRLSVSNYDRVGYATAIVQTFALMEVLHALFGWVRSPIATTAMQVSSRLFLVWGVVEQFPATHENPLFTSMVFAWSFTEVIRYTFYALALLGYEPSALLYLRYTTFYVLYPLGAGSEAFLNFSTLPKSEALSTWNVYDLFRATLFGIWWPGLYIMYTHMIKQRRKVFGGTKTGLKKE